MLFLLSPAKSLDYDTPTPALPVRAPKYAADAAALVEILRDYSPARLGELMSLSDKLAALNVARYGAWSRRFTRHNSKPAVLAFDGDVYDGLRARQFDAEALQWLDQHLLILSGLYGLLRPLDALQPYRLEMGTRLPTPKGADLYAWWGERLADDLSRRASREGSGLVINLASQEYFRAVDRARLRVRLIDCVFEDWKDDGYRVIGLFAKRARGAMVRHAVEQRADSVEALCRFEADGYAYDEGASTPQRLVFRRRKNAP